MGSSREQGSRLFRNLFATGRKTTSCFFLAAILALFALAQPVLAGETTVQWLGHAAFRIVSPGGKVILIDPFLTANPATPAEFKDLARLGRVDLILLTHAHGDHVGDTSEIARLTKAKVALNADLGRVFAQRHLVDPKQLVRFNKGGPIHPLGPGIEVAMVHAEHSSAFVLEARDDGPPQMVPGGEPGGYVIRMEDGFTLYHAGDTAVFGDMAIIQDYYRPDLALLPIGGHFTMDPRQAAYALKNYLKVRRVIPMHYGISPLLTGTPEQLIDALKGTQFQVITMRPGERRVFSR